MDLATANHPMMSGTVEATGTVVDGTAVVVGGPAVVVGGTAVVVDGTAVVGGTATNGKAAGAMHRGSTWTWTSSRCLP